MEPRIANDYAPQPAMPSESHPRAAEYGAYRSACARQLVTATPFALWLAQTEEFENGRVIVFRVTSRKAALAPGWYKNVFAPKASEPQTFGPFPTEALAAAQLEAMGEECAREYVARYGTPWKGRRACAVTGDPRVFMTFAEYCEAVDANRAAIAAKVQA